MSIKCQTAIQIGTQVLVKIKSSFQKLDDGMKKFPIV